MPLSSHESAILRYLGDRKSAATTRNITRDLRMTRRDARNALQELAGKGLVSKDSATFPPSWVITEIGSAVLAAARQEPK
jgi:DNA-binding IclR family transcriptional regulator